MARPVLIHGSALHGYSKLYLPVHLGADPDPDSEQVKPRGNRYMFL